MVIAISVPFLLLFYTVSKQLFFFFGGGMGGGVGGGVCSYILYGLNRTLHFCFLF